MCFWRGGVEGTTQSLEGGLLVCFLFGGGFLCSVQEKEALLVLLYFCEDFPR